MIESIGGPPMGHYYTAEEVRHRLERAKQDGELIRDNKGMYHYASGVSGTVGPRGMQGYQGSSSAGSINHDDLYKKTVEQFREMHLVDKPRRFTVRAFIREGIKDLKVFFKPSDKKEIEHGK